ncbi:MAG: GNAT family N-acetyltransferase [Bacillota bacterium]
MKLPMITPELTRRLERVWAAERVARVQVAERQPGNPLGAATQRFGEAVSVRYANRPQSHWMNRAINLTGDALVHLDAIFAFHREAGVGFLELAPATASHELMRALAERGASQVEFHTVTYGLPTLEVPAPPPGVEVRRVERHEMDLFLDIYMRGFGYAYDPESNALLRPWYDLPDWHLYLATVDGVPAGAAQLTTTDRVGYMAAGATLEEARGRGVQKALLYRRIADAARAGCELLMGQCDFGTISHRNQETCGLRTAYVKSVWAIPGEGATGA